MRVFWAGFLTLGLILIGVSAYEGLQPGRDTSGVSICEDGTPMPQPTPRPSR